ncbi:hypothetical protein, partial [Burkholderia cenocepacia]
YERNSPRMSSNSYVNLKIATCLVRYADDRLIDQRFPKRLKIPLDTPIKSANNQAGTFFNLPVGETKEAEVSL